MRAIATDPELLPDAIMSALDPQLVREVLGLATESKNVGSTIQRTTHEMPFAERLGDRVVFLARRRIVEQGPSQQIFGSPEHPLTREFLSRLQAPRAGVGGARRCGPACWSATADQGSKGRR